MLRRIQWGAEEEEDDARGATAARKVYYVLYVIKSLGRAVGRYVWEGGDA